MTPRFNYTFLKMSEKPVTSPETESSGWGLCISDISYDFKSRWFRHLFLGQSTNCLLWTRVRVFTSWRVPAVSTSYFLSSAGPLLCHLFSFSSVGCQITTKLHTPNGIYKRICHVTYLSRRKTDLIFFSTSTATHALLTPCVIRHWHIQKITI